MSEENQTQEHERQFALQRIYIKDISYETPNSPAIFTEEWKPEPNLNLNSNVSKLDNDNYEVVLTVTVTTKVGDKTAKPQTATNPTAERRQWATTAPIASSPVANSQGQAS